MFKVMATAALTLAASAAHGEEQAITFYAESDIRFVRAWDHVLDYAVAEFVSPRDGVVRCVAMDKSGDPVAVGLAYAQYNAIKFEGLAAQMIDTMACQYAGGK